MFEKIGQVAEQMASTVSMSRRGFFSRLAGVAGMTALGLTALWTPAADARNPPGAVYCCKKRGVTYCCCYQNDPNLSYCLQSCGGLCARLRGQGREG
jgi:hypothetical protein